MFLDLVRNELEKSRLKHGDILSAHEGLGIILEEFEEFKDEVKKRNHDHELMVAELVQIAAMAAKIAEDVCGVKP